MFNVCFLQFFHNFTPRLRKALNKNTFPNKFSNKNLHRSMRIPSKGILNSFKGPNESPRLNGWLAMEGNLAGFEKLPIEHLI